MTICIGAIVENKSVVAITDKMLTLSNPAMTTKYEMNENNKAIKLDEKTVALFAGDVIQGNEILSKARAKIAAEAKGTLEIANIVQETYKEQWKYVIESNLLSRYNLTIDLFIANQARLDPDLVKKINNIIGELNIGVEIIVAGVEPIPQLYLITNPGVITSYNSIGYVCTGSGSQHAILSLIESEYNGSITLNEAIYALVEAKKRAEFDPGVGQLCDILVIDTKYKELADDKIQKILQEHARSLLKIKRIITNTSQKMSKLLP